MRRWEAGLLVAAMLGPIACTHQPTLREQVAPYPANGQSLEQLEADSQACVDWAFANSPNVNAITNGALTGVKRGGPIGAVVGVVAGAVSGDPSSDTPTTKLRGRGSANYHAVSKARRSAYRTCMKGRGYLVERSS
jgi:hypothetical protein